MWCRGINSLNNVFPGWKKNISMLEKTHVDLITNLNFVKMQHWRHMECIWTFHQQNIGRFVGPHAAQAWPVWAMLMRGRSLLGQFTRYQAMMARPVLSKLFKAWSTIVLLIPVYDILILSQSRHSSAPNWHALNYWLTFTLRDAYLLMAL